MADCPKVIDKFKVMESNLLHANWKNEFNTITKLSKHKTFCWPTMFRAETYLTAFDLISNNNFKWNCTIWQKRRIKMYTLCHWVDALELQFLNSVTSVFSWVKNLSISTKCSSVENINVITLHSNAENTSFTPLQTCLHVFPLCSWLTWSVTYSWNVTIINDFQWYNNEKSVASSRD